MVFPKKEGGKRRSSAPSPNILLNLLRAYSARARGSFLAEKKGTKDSPKRRYPLWILLLGARPHLCFLRCLTFLCAVPRMGKAHSPNLGVKKILPRELCEAKLSPPDFPITKWLLGFVSVELRAVGTYVERTCYRYRGVSKGACPFREVFQTSEVKEPGGSLCALCETFFTQESFRGCGSRRPARFL